MMIIKTNESNFLFPFDTLNNAFVLVSNGYKQEIVECFDSYFNAGKKNKCIIVENNGQAIKPSDINFISLPKDLNCDYNADLKVKTDMNREICEIIKNNPEDFMSIDKLKNDLKSLLSDKGMIKITKIINSGLNNDMSFDYKQLDINQIMQMLTINAINLSLIRIAIINIFLHEHRDAINIVYYDEDIDDKTIKWINSLSKNVYVIIDSDVVISEKLIYDLLIMSDRNHLIESSEPSSVLRTIVYMNNPYIKSNLMFQSEKNIQILQEYSDKTSTFLIKNSCLNNCTSL